MSKQVRYYDDDDVARIFSEAADAERLALPSRTTPHLLEGSPEGLTLAQLQEIASEVGLSPDLVATAAAGLDRPGTPGSTERILGAPITVRHEEMLPGALSDEAWEKLVVEMRQIFGATGTSSRDGSLRQWRNGHLAVFLEPTPEGTRIRAQTTSDRVKSQVGIGVAAIVTGVMLMTMIFLSMGFVGGLIVPSFLAVAGGWALGSLIPRSASAWADLRAHQMRQIAARAQELATVDDEG